jgi:hypothetical protein
MIYFGLYFIRLSRLHNSKIMLDRLTQVDLTHFLSHFSIIVFINFIVQHWIRHSQLRIEFHNLF